MKELPPIPDHLGPLNPEQAEAVRHLDGPLLILAGAGSGKTRVLTRRIAYMLHVGVAPENILAVTFTNKAAAEMKERVADLVGEVGKDVWVSTFHSSCCRILRTDAEHLGYTRRFAIYDDDDQTRLVRQIVADLGYDPKVVSPRQILGRIDHFKNRTMSVDRVVDELRERPTSPLVRVWRAYEEQLEAADALDFNDLIGKTVELFQRHPDVLAKWRDKFHYVLVDEYQDTNRAQYELLRMLTSERRNLAVVGDDDQSIYGFRGADLRNILDFQRDFPDAHVIRMERNYRSTERILDVANAVVSKNADRIEKRLWTEHKKGGARVSFVVHDDPRSEARWVAQACRTLQGRGVKLQDIAIIYRTNATSQPFENALREAALPYRVVGGRQFYSRREIRDALAYVRLVLHPTDDAAFLRVVNVPPRGIGAKTLESLRDAARQRGEPLLKTAQTFTEAGERGAKALQAFVKLIAELVEVATTASLPAFVQQVYDRSGYVEMLQAEDSHEARGRLENLVQLQRDAAGFEPEEGAPEPTPFERVGGWLDRIALTGSDEDLPEGGEVTLMTVHCSKGLEYPYVFVVNMIEGQFPHSRSAEEEGGVAEERRLAYVAFTRAQDRLIVSRCRAQLQFAEGRGVAEKKPASPSRFLFGIPLEACDGEPPSARENPDLHVDTDDGPSEERIRAYLARQRRRPEDRDPRERDVSERTEYEDPPARAGSEGHEVPVGEYRTRSVESADQLRPGTRVLHERFGVGEIAQVRLPTVFVRFAGGLRPIGAADRALQILSD